MLQRIALGLFVCLAFSIAGIRTLPADEKDDLVTYYTRAFEQRRAVLEKVHGIEFDKDWKIQVNVGKLPGRDIDDWIASYLCENQDFWMNPKLTQHWPRAFQLTDFSSQERFSKDSPRRNDLLETIDHELGHAYADQVSRNLGLGCFPPSDAVYDELSVDERIATRIVSEGIGGWFQRTSLRDRQKKFEDAALPAGRLSLAWNVFDRDQLYATGLWLVGPVLERNCPEGIEYLLRNQFRYEKRDLRGDARSYRLKGLFYIKPKQNITLSPP